MISIWLLKCPVAGHDALSPQWLFGVLAALCDLLSLSSSRTLMSKGDVAGEADPECDLQGVKVSCRHKHFSC